MSLAIATKAVRRMRLVVYLQAWCLVVVEGAAQA